MNLLLGIGEQTQLMKRKQQTRREDGRACRILDGA